MKRAVGAQELILWPDFLGLHPGWYEITPLASTDNARRKVQTPEGKKEGIILRP
jgi:hypothetical protein